MELINFVFGVIKEISPISPEEHAQLKREIEQDMSGVITNPKLSDGSDNPDYKPTMKAKVLHFFRNPWVRLGMAASFLLVVKSIKDWYNGKFDEQEEIED